MSDSGMQDKCENALYLTFVLGTSGEPQGTAGICDWEYRQLRLMPPRLPIRKAE